jgi:hypothetical protein
VVGRALSLLGEREEDMDYREFFDELLKLREAGYTVYLEDSAIQLDSPEGDKHDPITAVCAKKTGEVYPTHHNYVAAQKIRLSNQAVSRIISAIYTSNIEVELRKQMLQALDLQA